MYEVVSGKLIRITHRKTPTVERTEGNYHLMVGRYRRIKGLSYARFSALLSINVRTAWLWEKGYRVPCKYNRERLDRLLKGVGTEDEKNQGPQSTSTPKKNSDTSQVLDLIEHSVKQKEQALSELEVLKEEKKKLNNRIRRVKAKKNKWAYSAAQRRKEQGPSSKNLHKWKRKSKNGQNKPEMESIVPGLPEPSQD